jgi:16S rRNA (uracil1498-N3)-methyltransferase
MHSFQRRPQPALPSGASRVTISTMRRRFFVDRFEANTTTLRGESADHLGRVLRAEPGQLYELSDGHRIWLARVERISLSKRGESRIEFALVALIPANETTLQIELLVSIFKFDRFEWCLEKATELGANEITPLAAARTDKPLLAAAGKRRTRWVKILLEAAQQSRRLAPPLIRTIVHPADAFARSVAPLKLLLSERRDAPPLRAVLQGHASNESVLRPNAVTLAIGPEGGWTEDELASAHAAGFEEVSLGANILRAETAVVAAIALLQFAIDDRTLALIS